MTWYGAKGGGLRCRLGFHGWDWRYEEVFRKGYGLSYRVIGSYCVRCGLEIDDI